MDYSHYTKSMANAVYVQFFFSRCMLNTVDGPSDTVEDYLCDPEEMPLGARKCTLPCPEDCVMSEWGSWSRCSLVRSVS